MRAKEGLPFYFRRIETLTSKRWVETQRRELIVLPAEEADKLTQNCFQVSLGSWCCH